MSFYKYRVLKKCLKDNRPYILNKECFEPEKEPKQTNADRIRAMSDEELAEFLCNVYDEEEDCAKFINGYYLPYYDEYSIKEWLKQPAGGENE